tara:strand:- start:14108 stop:15871 length:1764 start_codon:yes stop_codon:yes gene_type:complete
VPLFPQRFIDELKSKADIVTVIQDYVSLKKTGATYKGLCPFHAEKTPSFHVNRDKGFFHCFGCGVGGDIFKFLELHDKMDFPDAVKQLAQRVGLPIPEIEVSNEDRASIAERETLLKVHEVAATWFHQQLEEPAGRRVKEQLANRGISSTTAKTLQLGFAPHGNENLKKYLQAQGFSHSVLLRSGLVVERNDGKNVDRFRGRLMIPICRETGTIIAFGGRAIAPDQQPKYLNSPETPIYNKSSTLYGLNLTRTGIRQNGFAVLVEGYFDFAQVYQAGFKIVVASCGTALTPRQAALLRRFTSKIVLSFDPDTAGDGAAVRSCELLVAEGFDVNVALLPTGEDPDTLVRNHGPEEYASRLRNSRPYLEYLLERSAAKHDFTNAESRRKFLSNMLSVAAQIPDSTVRDQFADRLAHKARITEGVVRKEIRKAAAAKRTTITERELPQTNHATAAERALVWAVFHQSDTAGTLLETLDEPDLEGLMTRPILEVARTVRREGKILPSGLLERVSMMEAQLATAIAAESAPPVLDLSECIRELKRLRYDREQAVVQQEIDHLQELGAAAHEDEINALWVKKRELLERIAGLV